VSTTLVQGADPGLRDREVQRVVDELLGGDDRSFALDDHTIAARRRAGASEEPDDDAPAAEGSVELPAFAAITTALSSPPFMSANRVVVVREIGALTAEQAQWLGAWITDPLDGVHLVLVAGGGRIASALDKAVKANAEVVGPAAEQTAKVLEQQLKKAHVKLAPDAMTRVAEHLGDDAGRVPELVEVWHSTYGDDATLVLDDVEQYLGELGTAGRFDLTNMLDRGDVGGALETLHRLLSATSAAQPKPLHPMQVMASLSYHYQRLLRLDDPAIVTKEHAAAALNMKSAGGARFPLDASRRLGTDGLREAALLLAHAELDLRGASGLDERTVMEVLVARLAALSRRTARARR
jgi:DNA polymerase-3 subunit delta